MTATAAQVAQYQFHRRICQRGIPGLGPIGQATLGHRTLQGTLSAPSPTGNVLYTGPGASSEDIVGSTTAVWLVSQPSGARGGPTAGGDTAVGAQGIPTLRAQIPAIDDFGNAVTIAHEDLMTDAGGIKYTVQSPALTPDASLWVFTLVKIR